MVPVLVGGLQHRRLVGGQQAGIGAAVAGWRLGGHRARGCRGGALQVGQLLQTLLFTPGPLGGLFPLALDFFQLLAHALPAFGRLLAKDVLGQVHLFLAHAFFLLTRQAVGLFGCNPRDPFLVCGIGSGSGCGLAATGSGSGFGSTGVLSEASMAAWTRARSAFDACKVARIGSPIADSSGIVSM